MRLPKSLANAVRNGTTSSADFFNSPFSSTPLSSFGRAQQLLVGGVGHASVVLSFKLHHQSIVGVRGHWLGDDRASPASPSKSKAHKNKAADVPIYLNEEENARLAKNRSCLLAA
jgi:hypothetical protein